VLRLALVPLCPQEIARGLGWHQYLELRGEKPVTTLPEDWHGKNEIEHAWEQTQI
jgi:hypothetical protein